MDRIAILLSNGHKLVVDKSEYVFDKELCIGIEDENGHYIQDLAIVRPTYKIEDNNVEFDSDKFEVLVFADKDREDFTDKFVIPLYKGDEDEV